MATAPSRIPDPEAPAARTDETPIEYTHEHPTAEEIAAEAYAIYIAHGGEHGRDFEDWLEAERRLKVRRR